MILLGKLALGVGGSIVVAAGLLCSEGLLRVDVRESGPEAHHIFIVAPAVIAPIGIRFVPSAKLQDAAQQIRPWMPAIRAGIASLREENDMTLVDVSDAEEHVSVRKEGGSIVVDVKDANENVHVSAPLRAISSTVEEIAAVKDPGKS